MTSFLEKVERIDHLFTLSSNKIHCPAELKSIILPFIFTFKEIQEYLIFPEDLPYGRNCVFRSENFDVIIMNWKPFKRSNIHDHGASFGCVYSVSGKANNLLFDGELNHISTIPLINNAIAEVPQGIFHVIENNCDEYAVSIHFYAPPLKGMRVIDATDKSKSFIVQEDCGAWNPKL